MAINYRGERFSGYNKPKRTPGKSKKFAVLAKKGDKVRLIRFGDPNMTIKKDQPKEENLLEQDIDVIQVHQINYQQDIGHARSGNE